MRNDSLKKLIDIRSDLQKLLVRLDDAIGEGYSASSEPRSRVPRMQQTYLEGYDFRRDLQRGDRTGFSDRVNDLLQRVLWVDENSENFSDEALKHELQLRAAEARLLQSQASDRDPEWNDIVSAIRTLTRITTDERPGFIYGLAFNHTTDWGKKIEDVLSVYTPPDASVRVRGFRLPLTENL